MCKSADQTPLSKLPETVHVIAHEKERLFAFTCVCTDRPVRRGVGECKQNSLTTVHIIPIKQLIDQTTQSRYMYR